MEYICEIVIALFALAGTVIGSFSGFRLTAYRVEQLERKVEGLCGSVEKLPLLEARLDRLEEKEKEERKQEKEREKGGHIAAISRG
ncbi:MAG: hypothetical protein ACI4V1_10285 [Eubacteriales bacterium]